MKFKELKIGEWFSSIDDVKTTYILAEDKIAYQIDGKNIGQSFIFFDDNAILPKNSINVKDTMKEYVLDNDEIDPEVLTPARINSGEIINIMDTVEPYVAGYYLTCSNGKLIHISSDNENTAKGDHYNGQILDRKKLKIKFFTYGFYTNDMPTLYYREFEK